ncbi:MAG: G patch domain-containing protein, partial [Rhodospirillales bacterium]|nr:G patch domain-containing protein [Rhodospirillales bacterium]
MALDDRDIDLLVELLLTIAVLLLPSTGGAKSGHHIGDFLPNKDEVDKAFSKRLAAQLSGEPLDDDAEPAAAAVTATGPAVVLPASSKGHKLMSKMGWTAGSSLGSKGDGIVAPIAAGNVKLNTLGIGLFCWAIIALAVYALPFFVALIIGMMTFHSDAGLIGAMLIATAGGALTLIAGLVLTALGIGGAA